MRLGIVEAAAIQILGDGLVIGPGIGCEEGELEAAPSGGPSVTLRRRAPRAGQVGGDVVHEVNGWLDSPRRKLAVATNTRRAVRNGFTPPWGRNPASRERTPPVPGRASSRSDRGS